MLDPQETRPERHATSLRQSFERARTLGFDQQIQECADLLQHPDLVVSEVVDAYHTVASRFAPTAGEPAAEPVGAQPKAAAESPAATLVEDFFWETRELMVLGDKCSFTCLATNVEPHPALCANGQPAPRGLSVGLDYVGLTCDSAGVLVLGAAQAPGDATAYPLLLRLLACLTEISPRSEIERLNRERLKGIADPTKPFDLNLVLWDREDEPELTPISQLTRDLAEKVKDGLRDEKSVPANLRDIVCLQMNPDRFDGRMRFQWRV